MWWGLFLLLDFYFVTLFEGGGNFPREMERKEQMEQRQSPADDRVDIWSCTPEEREWIIGLALVFFMPLLGLVHWRDWGKIIGLRNGMKQVIASSIAVIVVLVAYSAIFYIILPERESPEEVEGVLKKLLEEPPQPTPQITAEDSIMEAELIKRLSEVAELTYFVDYSSSAAYDIAVVLERDINGVRVPSNYVEAYKWYTISILLGYDLEFAEWDRDALAKVMPTEQITQAEHLAQEWMEKNRGQNEKSEFYYKVD